jgi:hypothetical protein
VSLFSEALIFIAAITLAATLSAILHYHLDPSLTHRSFTAKRRLSEPESAIPVNAPRRLALDPQGNLLRRELRQQRRHPPQRIVRPTGGGNNLKRRVSTVGVAVDPYGNVFVSNPFVNLTGIQRVQQPRRADADFHNRAEYSDQHRRR